MVASNASRKIFSNQIHALLVCIVPVNKIAKAYNRIDVFCPTKLKCHFQRWCVTVDVADECGFGHAAGIREPRGILSIAFDVIGDQRSDFLAHDCFHDVAVLAEVEHHQWQIMFHAV